jgi:hypothetical protein
VLRCSTMIEREGAEEDRKRSRSERSRELSVAWGEFS